MLRDSSYPNIPRKFYTQNSARFCNVATFDVIWFRITDSRRNFVNITCTSLGSIVQHVPHTRYVKLQVADAPGMLFTFPPPTQVIDTDMHHGTCMTHVPWCMPGSLSNGFLWSRCGENVPGIPGACTTRNFAYLARGPCERACWWSSTVRRWDICRHYAD